MTTGSKKRKKMSRNVQVQETRYMWKDSSVQTQTQTVIQTQSVSEIWQLYKANSR